MEGSKLGGPWNVPCLVAFEMNPMFGGQWGNIFMNGQWKVPMFGGLWKEKEKRHFHLLSFFTP
jgi:hypothetical protein